MIDERKWLRVEKSKCNQLCKAMTNCVCLINQIADQSLANCSCTLQETTYIHYIYSSAEVVVVVVVVEVVAE